MPHLFGRHYSRQAIQTLTGDMSQLAHARRAELVEGNERGADLIEVFNASGLCFSVLPGRALDIAAAHYKGMSLCFRSSTGDVGPAFHEPAGFGLLRGFFGGLVATCGLTFVGHPEVDPEEENEALGLHGRISFTPAKQVCAGGAWEGDDYVITVGGTVRESVAFGTDLQMTRRITTRLGERTIRIHDRVENLAAGASPLMFLYHMNPGFPLLDVGARFVVRSERSLTSKGDRPIGPDVYERALPPQADEHDEVFVHWPIPDADGQVEVALLNETLGLGLAFRYPRAELPILSQWQYFTQGNYVTGVEPGNCSPLGRAWNRKHDTLQYIDPGEARDYHMSISVLDGAEEMAGTEKRILG